MGHFFLRIAILGLIAVLLACAHSSAVRQSRPSTPFLFGMPVATLSPADIAQSNTVYNYLRGDLILLEGQPQRSIPELSRAIAATPDAAYLYLSRATAYAAAQQMTEAETDCLKALELNPQMAPAKLLMARLLSVQGKFGNAIPLLEELVRKTPDVKEAYPLLAVAYMNIGRHTQAIHSMKRLLASDPDAIVAYYYMGAVYGTYLKQPALALQMYRKILDRDPRNISVYNAIVQLYVDQKNIPKAIATLNEAFESGVDDATLRLRLSSLYYQIKNYEKAAATLEGVLQRTPGSNKVRYYLGVIYEENGDFEKAREQYNQVAPDSGFFKDAMLRQSLHYYRGAHLGAAMGVLQMAVIRAPRIEEFYSLLALLHEEMDNLAGARQVLERGTRALPKSAALHYTLGVVMDRMKDTDAALKTMRRVMELDADNVSAMNYVGYTYAERGVHLDEAEDLLLRAAQMQPQDGYILDSLGWLYFRRNEYGKALAVLEQAVKVAPSEPVVYKHLGDLYAAMGRTRDAARCYEQAIALLKIKSSEEVDLEKLQEALSAVQK